MDVVQVHGAPLQKRRWGASVTERCDDDKRLLIGVGRTEEGKNRTIHKHLRQVGQVGLELVLIIIDGA